MIHSKTANFNPVWFEKGVSMKNNAGVLLFAIFAMVLVSCGGGPPVQRVDANTRMDLSGYWNDKDVKIVCESLINDCLSSQRVSQALKAFGKKTAGCNSREFQEREQRAHRHGDYFVHYGNDYF